MNYLSLKYFYRSHYLHAYVWATGLTSKREADSTLACDYTLRCPAQRRCNRKRWEQVVLEWACCSRPRASLVSWSGISSVDLHPRQTCQNSKQSTTNRSARSSLVTYQFAQPDSSEYWFLIWPLLCLCTTPPRPPQDPLHLVLFLSTHVLILLPLIVNLSDSSSGLLQAPLQENDLWRTNHTTPLTSRWGPKN